MKIILDTDMHDTCDDVGAMGIMHILSKDYDATILAVTYSAYDEPGLKCIEIINRFFGNGDILIGTNKGLRLDYSYNMRNVSKHFDSTITRAATEDAYRVLRKVLANNKDVSIIGIGPLFNLNDLLMSEPDEISPKSGIELIKENVSELILMAGMLPQGSEYNIYIDPGAANNLFEKWPTKIIICDFSIGAHVTNGISFKHDFSNPISAAYSFNGPSESYDLLTMHFAITRDKDIWELSKPGKMKIEGSNNYWVDDENGNHCYLILKVGYKKIEKELEDILLEVNKYNGNA